MFSSLRELFDFSIQELRARLPSDEATIWLSDLQFAGEEGKALRVATGSFFKKEKITKSYLPILSEILRRESGEDLKIEVQVLPDLPPPVAIKKFSPFAASPVKDSVKSSLDIKNHKENSLTKNSAADSKSFDAGILTTSLTSGETQVSETGTRSFPMTSLDPAFCFDRYVRHANNRLASECAQKITAKLGSLSPLYLYGASGSGKTHLMQAIGHHYREHFPFLKIQYVVPDYFVAEYVRALETKTDRLFRLKYRSLDVLLLDDVQFLMGKKETSAEFFHIFNEVYQPGKQLVFSSDRVPAELDRLDERLKSRLSSGVIVELEAPGLEARGALLDFYTRESELRLSPEVLEFLAASIPPDARKIIGAIKTLVTFKDILGEEITVAFCRERLKEILLTKSPNQLSPAQIILAVANYSRISLSDLKSPKRTQSISYYRQLAMYLLRKHTKLSLSEIANLMGGKTPASVTLSAQAVEEKMQGDPEIAEVAEKILQNA